jgi:hypothetical protein
LAAGDTVSYSWAVGGVWISPAAPSAECFTPYHGNEIIAWPSGTNNASPTFNATFFEAGEYIIQVNVTAKITHSGGSVTTLNATGYIGGDQSDIGGGAAAMAAVANGSRGPTRMVMTSGFRIAKYTFVERILVPDPVTIIGHEYIRFNRSDIDTFGFWPGSEDVVTDKTGIIMSPDPEAGSGHDISTSADPVFIERVRKICMECLTDPPEYGFLPDVNVCITWTYDVFDDARTGTPYTDPCTGRPPYYHY